MHVSIASIKLLFKFEYKFSPTNDNQDGQQNGNPLQFAFVGNQALSFLPDYLQISFMDYFYQTLALSENQDGRKNGPHLSVYTCGHSILVIQFAFVDIYLKAAYSVTFDILILELMFLFFKNTVKKSKIKV